MIEKALSFGPEDNLVGVLTTPDGNSAPVAVLLLSSGVVHRVGPHRLSVKLARHLAQLGYECMRFDVSGVGDSRNPRDAAGFRVQDVRDTQAAMDWLARERGFTQFALFGICSGAVNAYASAMSDSRVMGIFMLDGFIYPTMKGRLIYYAAKLRAFGLPKALRLAIAGAWARIAAPRSTIPVTPDADRTTTRNPSPEEFGDGIQRLTDRGVRVALMFTGSVLHEYSYAGQMRDAFRGHRFLTEIDSHFMPEMDHTATSIASQQLLIRLATAWVQRTTSLDRETVRLEGRAASPIAQGMQK